MLFCAGSQLLHKSLSQHLITVVPSNCCCDNIACQPACQYTHTRTNPVLERHHSHLSMCYLQSRASASVTRELRVIHMVTTCDAVSSCRDVRAAVACDNRSTSWMAERGSAVLNCVAKEIDRALGHEPFGTRGRFRRIEPESCKTRVSSTRCARVTDRWSSIVLSRYC